jgi:hypothetical protein
MFLRESRGIIDSPINERKHSNKIFLWVIKRENMDFFCLEDELTGVTLEVSLSDYYTMIFKGKRDVLTQVFIQLMDNEKNQKIRKQRNIG